MKTIAEYIDVHLGIDDEAEGKTAQVKKRNREQTGNLFLFWYACSRLNFTPQRLKNSILSEKFMVQNGTQIATSLAKFS